MAKCRTVRKMKFPGVSETIITPKASHSILHSNTDSYFVVSLVVFQEVLDSMAKCLVCNGRLELRATGTSSGCASYLNLKCSMCYSEKKFWSVGNYSHSKIQIGSSQIPKGNSMVFTSVLAGRLMGVGWHKLYL